MHAISIKQPWAEAIARHGKNVENRSRRPPAHLLGQRIAIHVSQANDAWGDFRRWDPLVTVPDSNVVGHLRSLRQWERPLPGGLINPTVPHAGRIVATARLVGWVADPALKVTRWEVDECEDGNLDPGDLLRSWWENRDWRDVVTEARQSPWFTGPVGWVLADVRALREPVGLYGSCGRDQGIRGGHNECETCGHMVLEHQPIRGQVYPFLLDPEVEAAVLAQEAA